MHHTADGPAARVSARVRGSAVRSACCPHGATFTSYGVTVRLAASSPQLLQRMTARLPPFSGSTSAFPPMRHFELREPTMSCACGMAHSRREILVDAEAVFGGPTADAALDRFRGLVKQFISEHAPSRLFLHGGVVARNGRGILVPGLSTGGRARLIQALVSAGAQHFSDEFAVLDSRGLVWPYPQALHVRVPGQRARAAGTVDEFGAPSAHDPVPIRLVVLTSFDATATWHPQSVPPAAALTDLLAYAPAAEQDPERSLRWLSRAVDGALVLRGPRGDAAVTAARLIADVDTLPR